HDLRQQVQVVPGTPRPAGERHPPAPLDVSPDVLVVAVPHREARGPAQPRPGLPRLGLDLAPQRLVLRVRRTREQEVLPNQDPGLVARVVEVLALVDPTT